MDTIATIIAALIGGVIGSLGAQWLGERYRRNQSIEATRREVAVRHLVQLQDALESLWFRIDNLAHRGGKHLMDPEYYETSSIYVIGYALAQKRLLTVEGAYAKMDVFEAGLSRALEDDLESLERALGDEGSRSVSFYRYQRRALADFLIKWDGAWRVLSYSEFVDASSHQNAAETIEPARSFLASMTAQQASAILEATESTLLTLQAATNVHIAAPISPRDQL